MAGSRKKQARVPTPPKSKQRRGESSSPLLTRRRLVIVGIVAAVLAVVLVGASLLSARGGDGDGGGNGGGDALIVGGPDAELIFDGVPQSGTAIGEEDAPVTLVEYADLQCPFCAQWARETFPELVQEYVRDGKLRIEFRGLTFIGPQSEDALRAAVAAGEQDKLWNVVDLLYVNQGTENSGWVTDDFLRSLGAAVPGLDVDRMMDARSSDEVTASVEESAAQGESDQVSGTPTFLLGETGGTLEQLQISSLGPDEFRAAIDQLLGE